jgi:hypothetical protein
MNEYKKEVEIRNKIHNWLGLLMIVLLTDTLTTYFNYHYLYMNEINPFINWFLNYGCYGIVIQYIIKLLVVGLCIIINVITNLNYKFLQIIKLGVLAYGITTALNIFNIIIVFS